MFEQTILLSKFSINSQSPNQSFVVICVYISVYVMFLFVLVFFFSCQSWLDTPSKKDQHISNSLVINVHKRRRGHLILVLNSRPEVDTFIRCETRSFNAVWRITMHDAA